MFFYEKPKRYAGINQRIIVDNYLLGSSVCVTKDSRVKPINAVCCALHNDNKSFQFFLVWWIKASNGESCKR
jgi:hypothetical protein